MSTLRHPGEGSRLKIPRTPSFQEGTSSPFSNGWKTLFRQSQRERLNYELEDGRHRLRAHGAQATAAPTVVGRREIQQVQGGGALGRQQGRTEGEVSESTDPRLEPLHSREGGQGAPHVTAATGRSSKCPFFTLATRGSTRGAANTAGAQARAPDVPTALVRGGRVLSLTASRGSPRAPG